MDMITKKAVEKLRLQISNAKQAHFESEIKLHQRQAEYHYLQCEILTLQQQTHTTATEIEKLAEDIITINLKNLKLQEMDSIEDPNPGRDFLESTQKELNNVLQQQSVISAKIIEVKNELIEKEKKQAVPNKEEDNRILEEFNSELEAAEKYCSDVRGQLAAMKILENHT